MTVTTTSDLPSNVLAKYEKTFYDTFYRHLCWFNFVNWEGMAKGTGSSVVKNFSNPLDRAAQTRGQGADITPIAMKDMDQITISWVDYANGVQLDRMVDLQSQVNQAEAAGKQIAKQEGDYLDYFIREKYNQGTLVERMNARATRVEILAADVPSYNWQMELEAKLDAMGVEPYGDDCFVGVVHPLGAAELRKMTQFTNVMQYSDPKMYYTGKAGFGSGPRVRGEQFRLGRIRYVVDPNGKMFWGAGSKAATQVATTLGADAAAGATAIAVADATGLAAGNYITIGTLESAGTSQPTTEQVQIMAVDGTDLTIRGGGNSFDNFGLKFAHASGAAVNEGPNVCSLVLLGANSMYGIYESDLGKEGEQFAKKNTATFLPKLFTDYGWHWVGGATIVEKHVLRAEFGTALGFAGSN